MSITPSPLAQKLAEILAGVGRIEKKGTNAFHKYQYVMEADLVEAVRAKLAEKKIFISSSAKRTEVVEIPKGNLIQAVALLYVEYTFRDAETGETIVVDGVGEIDQDGGKGIYKAQTGAMKYMLMKNFLIATGDDPEQDSGKEGKKPDAKPAQSRERTYSKTADRGFPATAPQVRCIGMHWQELTEPERAQIQEIRVKNGINSDSITKMQASFCIDEMVRIKKERKPGDAPGGGVVTGKGPITSGPTNAPPGATGGQQGPPNMTLAEGISADNTIRIHTDLSKLDAYMEDIRAMPKATALHNRLEKAYEETKTKLLNPRA